MTQAINDDSDILLQTEDELKAAAELARVQELSHLPMPQIDQAVEMIARLTPAGTVPGVILSGLARLPGRKLAPDQARRDTNALLAGLERLKDTAVYGTFFAGPAAVIWAYQSLLRLAGKNPEDAFPEGTWQFYVDYALREDTARHTTETHGFDTLFRQYHLPLTQAERMTAWTMAAITTLHQYNDLLRNEWRERVYTSILAQLLPDDENIRHLYRRWEQQRPYRRGADAKARYTYPRYRHDKFDRFLEAEMQAIPPDIKSQWVAQVRQARTDELPRYQQQMSILAYLEPGPYDETRRPIPLPEAAVGIIYQGQYYLIPTCQPDQPQPLSLEAVRDLIAVIIAQANQYTSATPLMNVDRIRRASWPNLYAHLNQDLVNGLMVLRRAPILLNFDKRPSHLPLAQIRQAERGIGDHALTIFDTGDTFIFDLSHIFFDGTWGAALAEIMTNEASAWATYLCQLPPRLTPPTTPITPVALPVNKEDWDLLEKQPRITTEAFAETNLVRFATIKRLREEFKKRHDLIDLTVNDLLVLYRAIHVTTYQPSSKLVTILNKIAATGPGKQAASETLTAVTEANRTNPAILIPVDASRRTPRDRLHPLSVAIPLDQLDLLNLHHQTVAALHAYKENSTTYETFDNLQRHYLATLAGIGQFLSRAKEIATAGETHNVGTIKMMAHLPTPVQRLLDKIPNRFELLNDIIKGREVFSNVGAVSASSTLTRFMTAKDDNENKHLAWGVITDAEDNMPITLRDFRPHVALLVAAGYQDLAYRLTQDYLEAYATGLNQFIDEILQITLASQRP